VKNGYGRNFLIPTGKASLATSSARKVLAENLKQRAYKEAKLIEDANIIAETVKGYEIKIASKTGSGDKLFGSVNNIDLAAALAKAGTDLDKKFIKVVGGSVKRLGKYEAALRLHRAVVADITFEVVSE
jgi:large subunit ribosomal protein L9